MNIKEYIESGILDAYALGALSEEECIEVQANMLQYPEIADEVAAIEASMQSFAEANAVQPPAFLKDKVWSAIQEQSNDVIQPTQQTPSPTATKEIPLPVADKEVRRQQINWSRAAVWIALVGSVLTNFLLWNQNNTTKQQVDSYASVVDSMKANQDYLAGTIDAYKQERAMLADPSMSTIVMHSMKDDKSMAGTVYWNKTDGEAYLALHNLPMPPKGKQYQLWAIKDGVPVDMGVIDNGMVAQGMMKKMSKTIIGGQAFAISLEDEGGSKVPNMEQIYVLGSVSS